MIFSEIDLPSNTIFLVFVDFSRLWYLDWISNSTFPDVSWWQGQTLGRKIFGDAPAFLTLNMARWFVSFKTEGIERRSIM